MNLEGKAVLVTASTRGIGYACVQRLAQDGATVYMAARRMDFADEQARKLNETLDKGCVKTVYFNAYEPECYAAMMKTVFDQEGHLDGLVNNFGTSNPKADKDIENTDYEEFKKTVDVNLESVLRSCQEAIPYMKKSGGGSIINISSVGGLIPDISQIAYGTSKAAINYLTKLIAVQEARSNIRCNAVLPGMTATDAVKDNLSDSFRDFFLKHTPIKRMGDPKEIAALVAFLASDECTYMTGQILEVSGGFGLPTPVYGDMIELSSKR